MTHYNDTIKVSDTIWFQQIQAIINSNDKWQTQCKKIVRKTGSIHWDCAKWLRKNLDIVGNVEFERKLSYAIEPDSVIRKLANKLVEFVGIQHASDFTRIARAIIFSLIKSEERAETEEITPVQNFITQMDSIIAAEVPKAAKIQMIRELVPANWQFHSKYILLVGWKKYRMQISEDTLIKVLSSMEAAIIENAEYTLSNRDIRSLQEQLRQSVSVGDFIEFMDNLLNADISKIERLKGITNYLPFKWSLAAKIALTNGWRTYKRYIARWSYTAPTSSKIEYMARLEFAVGHTEFSISENEFWMLVEWLDIATDTDHTTDAESDYIYSQQLSSQQKALDKYNARYNNHDYAVINDGSETGILASNAALELCGSKQHTGANAQLMVLLLERKDKNLTQAVMQFLQNFVD